jgi:hypothetical protein
VTPDSFVFLILYMKRIFPLAAWLLLSSAIPFTGCQKAGLTCALLSKLSITPTTTLKEDTLLLGQLYRQIDQLVRQTPCTAASQWTFLPLGNKPCGGPAGYLPFKQGTDCLTDLVSQFNEQSATYLSKYGQGSDCSIVPVPTGVACQDGAPVLVY